MLPEGMGSCAPSPPSASMRRNRATASPTRPRRMHLVTTKLHVRISTASPRRSVSVNTPRALSGSPASKKSPITSRAASSGTARPSVRIPMYSPNKSCAASATVGAAASSGSTASPLADGCAIASRSANALLSFAMYGLSVACAGPSCAAPLSPPVVPPTPAVSTPLPDPASPCSSADGSELNGLLLAPALRIPIIWWWLPPHWLLVSWRLLCRKRRSVPVQSVDAAAAGQQPPARARRWATDTRRSTRGRSARAARVTGSIATPVANHVATFHTRRRPTCPFRRDSGERIGERSRAAQRVGGARKITWRLSMFSNK